MLFACCCIIVAVSHICLLCLVLSALSGWTSLGACTMSGSNLPTDWLIMKYLRYFQKSSFKVFLFARIYLIYGPEMLFWIRILTSLLLYYFSISACIKCVVVAVVLCSRLSMTSWILENILFILFIFFSHWPFLICCCNVVVVDWSLNAEINWNKSRIFFILNYYFCKSTTFN